MGPFREGVNEWAQRGGQRGFRPENIRVYTGVELTGVEYTTQGAQYNVSHILVLLLQTFL